jgi:ribosomal protein S18 acetylase RimI-like enzyme
MDLKIHQYNQKLHKKDIFLLWENTLSSIWPLDKQTFEKVLFRSKNTKDNCKFIATVDNKIIGFVATQIKNKEGSIQLILVNKAHQRQGIGKKLLETAEQYLKNKKVRQIQLGAGGSSYFWPGVPKNLPHATSFFKSNGWNFTESSFDLVQDLAKYTTPPYVFKRIEKEKLKFQNANNLSKKQILKFEKINFPNWHNAFKEADSSDILYVNNSKNEILGTVVLTSESSAQQGQCRTWTRILGKDLGGFGALGIKKSEREKGIGLALAAHSTEVLKQRGIRNCLLGWTWLVDWYGKLGFKVWREYKMSWKKVKK